MSSTTPPNILLIHCHDLGRHLHCYGAPTVNSPNLDALAADGVLASTMFAAAPQCSPSRASLFTGRWPHSNGVMGLTHDPFGWDLGDEEHLARRLGRVGYRTELIGVHHESRRQPDAEVARLLGFDRVDTGGFADAVVSKGAAAMRRLDAAGTPFYLQVGFIEPHRIRGQRDAPGVIGFVGDHMQPDSSQGVTVPPYLADSPTARTEIAELQGAIRHMDAGVGGLLSVLDELGLADDTITIFTTDHGLALPRAKCSLYDPGVEAAFLIRWPGGGWTGGRRLDDLLVNVDVVPTLLDALGVDTVQSSDRPVHGRSFRPLLDGRPDELASRDAIFAEMTYHDYYDPRRSVRTSNHKLIVNFSSAPVFMDPSQSWYRRCEPVRFRNGNHGSHPAVELYDLVEDPLELSNVADEPRYVDIRAALMSRLRTWMAATADRLLDGAVTSPQHLVALDMLDDFDGRR